MVIATVTALGSNTHSVCDTRYGWTVQCFTSPPTQYRLYGRQFYRSKDPTNSIKVLKKSTRYGKVCHDVTCSVRQKYERRQAVYSSRMTRSQKYVEINDVST